LDTNKHFFFYFTSSCYAEEEGVVDGWGDGGFTTKSLNFLSR
jgi:hypothetical protein